MNGVEIFNGVWNGSPITWNVDELSPGIYTYTCTVYDESGNSISDSVIVTVTEKEVEEEEGFPWLWAGIGLVVGLVVGIGAAVLFFKKE